jgi:hypothetical protein
MEASEDFHDLFSDGATPPFDSSDPLDSFWAKLDATDLPRSATQHDRASVEPQALQQHTTEEEENTIVSPVCSCCMNGMAPLSHPRMHYATL